MPRTTNLTELTSVAQDDILPIVDTSSGQTKYVTQKNLVGSPDSGWTATGETWTYSSWTAATGIGVITAPSGADSKYFTGMRVRFSQSTGGTKYGEVVAVTSTSLSVYLLNSASLANETISSPVYSSDYAPVGVHSYGGVVHNPYKFRVYRAAALTSSTSFTAVAFDTKTFDTSSNVDVVTNKGRFTAPVAGFYFFIGRAGNTTATATGMGCQIRKNGVAVDDGNLINPSNAGNYLTANSLVQLAANDYVELFFVGGGGSAMAVGSSACYFSGFLVSTT